MQGWMIALIVVAAVIAFLAVAFLISALYFVHSILGRRKPAKPFKGTDEEREAYHKKITDTYGVDFAWLDNFDGKLTSAKITAYDGVKLNATVYAHEQKSDRVAICCHGYTASARAIQPQIQMFYERGFDVYAVDMRGHGSSAGKVGMAWIDRFDLLRWIDKVIYDYGNSVSIALFGVSMGGATAIAASGMNPPSQVKCVIDDCGFNSQYHEYAACLSKKYRSNASGEPSSGVRFLLLPLSVGVKLVHGYSIYDADIGALAKNATLPALFFHGEADDFVPFALGKKLYESYGATDKLFIPVKDAVHAAAYAVDKDGYKQAFTEFIDKHFPPLAEPSEKPAEQEKSAE